MTDLAVTWPIVVLGSLSLAGCGFIVFWILLLRKFTKFYYRLVLWIALSEILGLMTWYCLITYFFLQFVHG